MDAVNPPHIEVNMYKITDWAGNDLEQWQGAFNTFQDAWSYILGEMTDNLKLTEEDYQEYFVNKINPNKGT